MGQVFRSYQTSDTEMSGGTTYVLKPNQVLAFILEDFLPPTVNATGYKNHLVDKKKKNKIFIPSHSVRNNRFMDN